MGREYETITYKSQKNDKKINFVWKVGVSQSFIWIMWYLCSEWGQWGWGSEVLLGGSNVVGV